MNKTQNTSKKKVSAADRKEMIRDARAWLRDAGIKPTAKNVERVIMDDTGIRVRVS